MDAFDTRENRFVAIKHICARENEEFKIFSLLSNFRDDPRNHCVPILETIPIPGRTDEYLSAMPLLRGESDSPPFECVGQYVEYMGQLLEARVQSDQTRYGVLTIRIYRALHSCMSLEYPMGESYSLSLTLPPSLIFAFTGVYQTIISRWARGISSLATDLA
jgi:hypothetical protein